MKKYCTTLILVLFFCRLTIQLDGADFDASENAKRLYHIGKEREALEMCRQAAKKGNIKAQLQLAEWLFAKRSKPGGNPSVNPDQSFQKPQMDIERANRHNERLDRANAGGDQPKQGGGEKPKQGIGQVAGKTGQFSPGGT